MVEEQSGFWEFSLAFYAIPAVQQACLRLQDSLGADVNILLFVLYQANQGKQITAETLSSIDKAVRRWREDAIQPLRVIRRQLKQTDFELPDGKQAIFRKNLMALELDAEKLEQQQLEALELPTTSVPEDQAANINLRHYANFLSADIQHQDFATLLGHFLQQKNKR